MKAILATVLLITAGFVMIGCESDLPPEPKTEGPLVRGLSGQGKLVPVDNSRDPFINESTGRATY